MDKELDFVPTELVVSSSGVTLASTELEEEDKPIEDILESNVYTTKCD